MDDSGMVYFSSDLTFSKSIEGSIDDMVVYGSQFVVARKGWVVGYDSNFRKLGQYFPLKPALKIFVNGSTIFTFFPRPDGIDVTPLPASAIGLTGQKSTLDPASLSFWSSDVLMGNDGQVTNKLDNQDVTNSEPHLWVKLDGSSVVTGAGHLFDANTLMLLHRNLFPPILAAAWIGTGFYAAFQKVDGGGIQIRKYDDTTQQVGSLDLDIVGSDARLFAVSEARFDNFVLRPLEDAVAAPYRPSSSFTITGEGEKAGDIFVLPVR